MSEYDDSHMLSKTLERIAAQAKHLKEKIDLGLEIPSWAEYKVYSAYDGIGKALGTAYPGEFVGASKEAASTESQVLKALSAEGGAAGMKALKKRVRQGDLQTALKSLIDSGKVRRHPDGDLIKESAATATKTDPQKWEQAKAEARAKMGGKHSARAMQLATKIYKDKGGGYSGAKPSASNNSLKKWTKQDWKWTGGDKPGEGGRGVYLPKQKADRLRQTEEGKDRLARAARQKREATRQGEQYSSHGLAANTSLKK
jgi:hypothetical protein